MFQHLRYKGATVESHRNCERGELAIELLDLNSAAAIEIRAAMQTMIEVADSHLAKLRAQRAEALAEMWIAGDESVLDAIDGEIDDIERGLKLLCATND